MGLFDREVGAAVAATAVALSPRARRIVRQGAVYGLAGAIKAGDVVFSTARGAVRGAQQGVTGDEDGAGQEAAPPPEPSTTSEPATAPRRATRTRTPRSTASSPDADES